MFVVWRMLTARFADNAFSGEGARLFGGRWNLKGTPIVYTAGSQSLAVLEMMTQDEPLRARYLMIPAMLPKELKIDKVVSSQLPANWREPGAREQLQKIGGDWVKSGSSAVLVVPSAVIPAESNYLLNPLHPAFKKIEFGPPEAFLSDPRLIRR